MEPRRYAILGSGALGGYYGARLARHGCEVHFLMRSDFDHAQRYGLTVESIDGDLSIPADQLHAYRDVADMPPCNIVCVCAKTTANDQLAPLIPRVLADDGVVVMIQNGLNIEPPIGERVGHDRVYGALAFLCSNRVGPAHIRHLDYGKLTISKHTADGEPGGVDDVMRAIIGDFENAGLPMQPLGDLVGARWRKLVWNVPYNGLSVVLDTETDALMDNPDARALVVALMEEVLAGAASQGRVIEPAFVQQMLDHTARMAPYRTSMKIDADEKRPMEVESIFGEPIRAAAAAGVDLAKMAAVYRQLKFIDARNAGPRGW